VNILLERWMSRFWVLSPWSWYCITPPPYYSDVESSSKSSQSTSSRPQTYYYPYENYAPGFILIVGIIIMMILCLIAIQYGNDYISSIYECILYNLLYYACILICFYRWCMYLCFRFMFSMLGDRFWICGPEYWCLHFLGFVVIFS